jgi:hypothetical protein
MVGERDFTTKQTFRVRETKRQVLRAGRTNLVNLEHDYVHGFEAGRNGAQGLDITTRLRERRPTPYLGLGKRPVDELRAIWEGRWIYD